MNAPHRDRSDVLATALQRALLPKGVDENGWSDLHFAAALDLPRTARALLAGGAPANARLKGDGRQLGTALKQTMRDLGLLFDTFGRERDTPLHLAAWSDAAGVAQVLLANGADVDARLQSGGTPLHVAARFDSAATAAALLGHGAVLLGDGLRWTPLHCAACRNALATTKLLIRNGASVHAAGHDYWTALHLAALGDAEPVARALLDSNADVNAATKQHHATPLDFACAAGAATAGALLRRRGGRTTDQDTVALVRSMRIELNLGWSALRPVSERLSGRRGPRSQRRPISLTRKAS